MPKPGDWGDYIDVTGYLFLGEGARSAYQPDEKLAAFLAAGPPPVYLGEPALPCKGYVSSGNLRKTDMGCCRLWQPDGG